MGSPYINIAYDHNQDHIMGEGEDHIATIEDLSPEEELLPFMEEGSNVDGDESGGTSPSRQGAGTGILSPRNLFSMAAEIGIASGEKRSGNRVSSAGVKIGAKGGTEGGQRSARRVP